MTGPRVRGAAGPGAARCTRESHASRKGRGGPDGQRRRRGMHRCCWFWGDIWLVRVLLLLGSNISAGN